jgi:hypothetical protein
MVKRVAALAIVVGLLPSASFAQSLKGSIVRQAEASLARVQRPAAQGRNPYATTAIVLMAGGGVLAILGFLDTTGFECSSSASGTTVGCGTTKNKGLIFAGLGTAAVGALLYKMGEDRRGSPMIAPIPGGVYITGHFGF